MAKYTRQQATQAQSYFPVKVPVYTLSGGVGRQIPSKRLPTEVESMTNFFCTTQNSLDKRNGSEFCGNLGTLPTVTGSGVDQVFFHWTEVDAKTSILIIIDTGIELPFPDEVPPSSGDPDPDKPTRLVPESCFKAFKIVSNSEKISDVDITQIKTSKDGISFLTDETLEYLAYGGKWIYSPEEEYNHSGRADYLNPNPIPARERLRAVNIGSAILVLNKEVKAGFTSVNGNLYFDKDINKWRQDDDIESLDYKKKLNGRSFHPNDNYTVDFEGADLSYLTSVAVDRQGDAEIWVESQDYVWGSKVIDLKDPVIDVNATQGDPDDGYPWDSFAGHTWTEIIEPYRGGLLQFDFNAPVRMWEPTSATNDFLSNRDLGCQITLKGLDTEHNSNQTHNYLWIRKNGGTNDAGSDGILDIQNGDEFWWTTNGSASGPEGTGPERARTFAVNTHNLAAQKARAEIDFNPHGYHSPWRWFRYPRHYTQRYYGRLDAGDVRDFRIDLSTLQATTDRTPEYLNNPAWSNTDGSDSAKWIGGVWGFAAGGWPLSNSGYGNENVNDVIIDNRRVDVMSDPDHEDYDPDNPIPPATDGGAAMQNLAYIQLTDHTGVTARYYVGLGYNSNNSGEGWCLWNKGEHYNRDEYGEKFPSYPRVEDDPTLADVSLRTGYTDGNGERHVYIVDCWEGTFSRVPKNFKKAIEHAHKGKITVVAEGHKIVMEQDTAGGGDTFNTEIKFNLNDHLGDNAPLHLKQQATWGSSGTPGGIWNWLADQPFFSCNGSFDGADPATGALEDNVWKFLGGRSGDEVPSYTAEQRASGYADAEAFANTVNTVQGATVTALANRFSLQEPDKLYPGRVIITQNFQGNNTNTNVWTNDFEERVMDGDTYEYSNEWNINLFTADSIPASFTNGTPVDGSINDVITQTWTDDGEDTGEGSSANTFEDLDEEAILTRGDGDNRKAVRFGIWEVRDYIPSDDLPGPTNILLAKDGENKGSQLPPHEDKIRWKRVDEEDSDLVDGDIACNVATSLFIPVEDYIYPNSTYVHLGQSFTKLSDIKFPPDNSDLVAFNGGDIVEESLGRLYDEDPDSDTYGRDGKGKILYLSQAYLQNTPGWYRITKKDKAPYIKKIRTTGKRTILDKYRMPQLIFSEVIENETYYKAEPVDWDMRLSGDEESNRGPGIFFNSASGEPQESKITAMAFYRDRLFLANEDTIIASRSGDWDNFFLADPDNIVDADPLDLMISSNNYTPVSWLVPFRDFLFVGTSGNTQYELTGSNNIISPLTAEFAPTAFYPMMPEVPPVTMNNNLFFFSKGQLYIYFGQRDLATEQAFEVSKHVPNYLPDTLIANETSGFGSMLFGLEKWSSDDQGTNPSKIYCYRNQISGEKVVQNAFFDWTFSSFPWGDVVDDIYSWDKYLYLIQSSEWYSNSVTPEEPKMWLSRIKLDKQDINIPRLDNLRPVNEWLTNPDILTDPEAIVILPENVSYNEETNKTRIVFSVLADPYYDFPPPFWDYIITKNGEVVPATRIFSFGTTPGTYEVEGNYTYSAEESEWCNSICYVGRGFTSTVTLSPIFLRDEMNNMVPGTLNLRSGLIQTFDSKKFEIDVSINNRAKKTHKFDHLNVLDSRESEDYIGSPTLTGKISNRQERFPILGFTEAVEITISSDNPHPLNIASLQFAGKFKPITRYHNS